jgi:DNA polymerase III alpha subunit
MEDLMSRVALHAAEAVVLVKSGALDGLVLERSPRFPSPGLRSRQAPSGNPSPTGNDHSRLNRPQRLWFVESWVNRAVSKGIARSPLPFSRAGVPVPLLPDLSSRQTWQQEMDALGLILSVHPLAVCADFVLSLPQRIVRASELPHRIGQRIWLLGWLVTRKEVLTKAGETMEFVSFEDETAIYETVFFPKTFQRFCQKVDAGRGYLLYGQVESEFGAVSVTVLQVSELTASQGRRLAV